MKPAKIGNRSVETLVFLLVVTAQLTAADTFIVDTELDTLSTGCSPVIVGDCSLRGAIERANSHPGTDIVTFGFSASDFTLTRLGADEDLNQTGDLDILDVVHIVGNGNTVIDATLIGDRVFDISSASEDMLFFKDLTVTGGTAPAGDALFKGGGIRCQDGAFVLDGVVVVANGPVREGGGVYSECDLTLNVTSINGNSATNGGGGISMFSGALSATLSAIVDNHAAHGGGLSVGIPATADLDNMTLSGNTATNDGSAVQNSGSLELDFVTIVAASPGVTALAHLNGSGVTTLKNTLIAGTCRTVPPGLFITGGGNLESPGDSCGLNPTIDLINVADAGLLPLGDYGGATLSHMPRASSPAVDDPLGSTTGCPTYDQRFGPSRPLDGNNDGIAACDIGAIERDHLFFDDFESGDTTQWSAGP
ncbi:MAG: hypothetical protein K8J08_15650 [Thermoanaerobaculia bacterium]|nr:hypothetical protein [Thermoanaerobaculia bacterium]